MGSEDCVHAWPGGVLNDAPCYTTEGGLPFAACCEVPSIPSPGTNCTSCPAGFSNVDAAGFCYATLAGSYTWDAAAAACRALGNSSSLATVLDVVTASSVIKNGCAGLLNGRAWIGLRDNEPNTPGHTDRAGTYWRWQGSGSTSTWFTTVGATSTYWFAGERELCAVPTRMCSWSLNTFRMHMLLRPHYACCF